MVRAILATLAGVLAGGIVVGVVEMAGHAIYPPPEGLDPSDRASIAAALADVPLGAKIAVVVAWCAGAFAAATVAALIARRAIVPGAVAAGLILAAVVANLVMIPHPLWMAVAGLAAPVLAGALALRLFGRRA